MSDWEKIKNLKNKNLRSENAKICSADINSLTAETAILKNLQVCNINGKSVCAAEYKNIIPTFQIVDYQINGQPADPFDPNATPVQPPNNIGINPQVWDTLWTNTVENLYNPEFGLKARLQCGRLTEKYIQNSKNCVVCPPNQLAFCAPSCGSYTGQTLENQPFVLEITEVNPGSLPLEIGSILSGDGVTPNTVILGFISGTGGVGTYLLDQENNIPPNTLINLVGGPTPCNCPSGDALSCPAVPIRILALDTYPVTSTSDCSSSLSTCLSNKVQQLLSAVSYNLEVRNLSKDLQTKVVSVMVQLSYLDRSNNAQLVLIDFSNKQFNFTLDSLYGEKFAANILISSELIKNVVAEMKQYFGNYAAAQIVVYMEEGLEVQFVAPPRKFARVAENSAGSANAQYLPGDSTYPPCSFHDKYNTTSSYVQPEAATFAVPFPIGPTATVNIDAPFDNPPFGVIYISGGGYYIPTPNSSFKPLTFINTGALGNTSPGNTISPGTYIEQYPIQFEQYNASITQVPVGSILKIPSSKALNISCLAINNYVYLIAIAPPIAIYTHYFGIYYVTAIDSENVSLQNTGAGINAPAGYPSTPVDYSSVFLFPLYLYASST